MMVNLRIIPVGRLAFLGSRAPMVWGLASVVSLLCADLRSQREARSMFDDEPVSEVTATGSLGYDFPVVINLFASQPDPLSVVTGVGLVGGLGGWIDRATGASTRHYLVSGRQSTTGPGTIEHWTWGGSGVPVMASSMTAPGRDFLGVDYDPAKQALYVLDRESKQVEWASWDGASPLPGPSSFVPLLSQADCPELASPDDYSLRVAEDSTTGGTYLHLVRFTKLVFGPSLHGRMVKEIDDQFVPPAISGPPSPSPQREYRMVPESLREGGFAVKVDVSLTSSGAAFELVDASTQQVLGSATVPSESNELTIVSSIPFVVGCQYQVKLVEENFTAQGMECHVRYGAPETTLAGVVLDHLLHAPELVVGNPTYSLRAGISTTNQDLPSPNGHAVSGWFAVAARDPATGVDPVVPVHGQGDDDWLLVTDSYVSAAGLIPQVPGQGTLVAAPIPIPNQLSLVGGVLLHQALIGEGGDWYLGDILGVQIKGQGGAGQGLSSPSTGALSALKRAQGSPLVLMPALTAAIVAKRGVRPVVSGAK